MAEINPVNAVSADAAAPVDPVKAAATEAFEEAFFQMLLSENGRHLNEVRREMAQRAREE